MPRTIESQYDPQSYDYVPIVLFRSHERVKNGRHVKVGRTELQAIADKHNGLWERYGRASPLSLGHTLDPPSDGSSVPEVDQPDTAGVALKFYVDEVPDEPGEHFLWATWCRPKAMRQELQKFESLSPEYYPSRHLLFPLSLLKSTCPELPDMPPPPTKYGVDLQPGEEAPYRLLIDNPVLYSQPKESDEMPTDDKMDDKKPTDTKSPEDKAVDKAQKSEEKGSKSDAADLQEIKAQLSQIMAVMPEIMELVSLMKEGPEGAEGQDDDSDDLLGPADAEDKSAPTPKEKDKDVVDGKDTGSPVKCDAAMPSATNCSIPGYKKEDYKMTDDEKLKYKAEIKAELEKEAATKYAALENQYKANQKVVEKLAKESRLLKAKEMVKDLEEVHMIQYSSDAVRNEDVEMLAKLDEEAAKKYVEMAKVRYQKKLPDSTEVQKAAKYAVEGEPTIQKLSPEEVKALSDKIVNQGVSFDQYMADFATKK